MSRRRVGFRLRSRPEAHQRLLPLPSCRINLSAAESVGRAADFASCVERDYWRDTPPDLGERELEIVLLLVEGLGDREVAERLNISDEAARSRGSALRRKLGAGNRAQAVARVLQLGLTGAWWHRWQRQQRLRVAIERRDRIAAGAMAASARTVG